MPHRLAVLLVCVVFPLIWVGGLVTTYDAGMAVPDWPNTFGYNLLLYPWQTWLLGPWDLFIEHGHRLLGALAGLLTIAFLVCVWRCDARRWMRPLAVLALLLVIAQGVLGGSRVLLDERLLAMVHGCVGPAFFAFAVALAVVTSRRWREATPQEHPGALGLQVLASVTCLLAYLQLIIGALVRHMPVSYDPSAFRGAVFFHLLLAAVLTLHVVMLAARVVRQHRGRACLVRPALGLLLLVGVQLALGAGTWVVNYGWPNWMAGSAMAEGYVVQRESAMQALVTTAHVATGSLILATSLMLALRSYRGLRWRAPSEQANTLQMRVGAKRSGVAV